MSSPRRPVSLLVALTARERRDFLPEPLRGELTRLADSIVFLDPIDSDPADWPALLARHNPEILVAAWKTAPLPAVLPDRLRYVCYLAGSVRSLVTRTHVEQGLLVTNWGDSISRTVAECALLHILAGLRRTTHWTLAMHRSGAWKDESTVTASLFGRSVGIRGFGRVARELLRLLAPFGCRVSVLAPDLDATTAAQHGVALAPSLAALFADHDVVVELAPLLDQTRGTITEAELRLLRPGGVFVNVGRGATVDEDALLRVAREGHIAVGLDVFSTEPLPADSPFRGLTNVSLSPHLAGPTTDRRRDAGAFALANLQAYVEGRPLRALITPAVYETST